MHLKMTLYHKLAVAEIFVPTKQRPRHNPRNLRERRINRHLLDLQLASILADKHTCKGKTLPT